MKERLNPDWLNSYLEYAKDEFCPEKFHFWTGVSVLAGALERKVWVRRDSFNLYPNLYVLLVGRPGVGKSSAANTGVNDFLRRLKTDGGKRDSINFLAVQNSEASFIQQAAAWREFTHDGLIYKQAASFFYASEASNSLKEMIGGGTITGCLTDFYDCPENWKKQLVASDIVIQNCCVNLLACATFSFLRKLVPRDEAEGGFASRLLFVIQKDLFVRNPTWTSKGKDSQLLIRLLTDLVEVHKMTGPLIPSEEFSQAYEEWFPKQDRITQGLASDRMQFFMARKHTNLLKIAMICSVSESSSGVLELRHWERALLLYGELEKDLPYIVESSLDHREHKTVTYQIMKLIHDSKGKATFGAITAVLTRKGMSPAQIQPAVTSLIMTGDIRATGATYELLGDPEKYL